MKLGISLPLIDIQGDPATVRDFAQAAEALGYDHLGAPDHVLGVNMATVRLGCAKHLEGLLPRPIRDVRVP